VLIVVGGVAPAKGDLVIDQGNGLELVLGVIPKVLAVPIADSRLIPEILDVVRTAGAKKGKNGLPRHL